MESEKIITESTQKLARPSSDCDEENTQKYNSEEKEKENVQKRKNARKEKLVARKEFEIKTIDLGKKEVEIEADNSSNSKAKKSYECSLCHEVISTFINFKAHLERFHEDKLIPISERIKKGSQWASRYKKCKKKENNTKKLYQCSLCHEVISTTFIEFKVHLEKFHEENISEIPTSERINDTSRWPFRFKKQDGNICHVCAKSFKGQKRLDRHIFYDHENSPKSNHKCENCMVYFFTEVDLILHSKNTHSGEKMCDQCGKTFEMPSLLKKHYLAEHSETAKIHKKCEICGYEGKTKSGPSSNLKSLHAHMLQKHPDTSRLGCQICNHQSTTLSDTYVHFKVRILILLPFHSRKDLAQGSSEDFEKKNPAS